MLKYEVMIQILDSMYDELLVYDNNYKILFANKACMRHYGISGKELIGKDFNDIFTMYWNEPAVLPIVYRCGKIYAAKAETKMGTSITTVATPIFDDEKNIKYVVMNVRDDINEKNLYENMNVIKEFEDTSVGDIVASCARMRNFSRIVKKLSDVDAACIIYGETGTGKSMYARYMHDIGLRKDKPFIYVNCAAIPPELMESELFGYTRGAFTGANLLGKEGLIKSADGGTIFFDEISELKYSLQAKLLHFLQDSSFKPVGSDKSISVNVKVISATNKNLKMMADNNQFREDLYYRLNVFELTVPPLRERKEDIPILTYSFLSSFCKKYSIAHEISDDVMEIFRQYSWPGNIRELKHTIERLVVMTDDILIDKDHLPSNMFLLNEMNKDMLINFEGETYESLMSKHENKIINEAYKMHPSSRKLADFLDINQTKAAKFIRKYISSE